MHDFGLAHGLALGVDERVVLVALLGGKQAVAGDVAQVGILEGQQLLPAVVDQPGQAVLDHDIALAHGLGRVIALEYLVGHLRRVGHFLALGVEAHHRVALLHLEHVALKHRPGLVHRAVAREGLLARAVDEAEVDIGRVLLVHRHGVVAVLEWRHLVILHGYRHLALLVDKALLALRVAGHGQAAVKHRALHNAVAQVGHRLARLVDDLQVAALAAGYGQAVGRKLGAAGIGLLVHRVLWVAHAVVVDAALVAGHIEHVVDDGRRCLLEGVLGHHLAGLDVENAPPRRALEHDGQVSRRVGIVFLVLIAAACSHGHNSQHKRSLDYVFHLLLVVL